MNQDLRPDNPKEFLKEIIRDKSENYGDGYIKMVIVKEKGENYLYLADIKIQHKEDPPLEEVVHEYEYAILATIPIKMEELLKLFDELETGRITIKSLKNIKLKGGFDQSCYQISSKTRYAGFYSEWPSWCERFSINENINLQNVYHHLTKPGQPAYPDVYEACHAFLQHEYKPNRNTPIGINFIVPDFRARIKFLEIAENQISILVEHREIPLDNLLVQVYCTKGENQSHNSEDLQLDSSGSTKMSSPFVPDHVHAYLIDLKTGDTLDSKVFGRWYSDRNDGIIVKTSKESLESMIGNGENQFVEFKRDLDKERNEFLESVVAFANTNDGTILLGVDDENRITGFFEDFEKIEKKIRGLISGNCEPDIEVNVEEVQMDNKPVIVIKVKEGKNKPYLLVGRSAYKRVEKDDLVFKRLDFDNISSQKNEERDTISGFA